MFNRRWRCTSLVGCLCFVLLAGGCAQTSDDRLETVFVKAVELWEENQPNKINSQVSVNGTTLHVNHVPGTINWEPWLTDQKTMSTQHGFSDSTYQVISVHLTNEEPEHSYMKQWVETLNEEASSLHMINTFDIWLHRTKQEIHRMEYTTLLQYQHQKRPQEEAMRLIMDINQQEEIK